MSDDGQPGNPPASKASAMPAGAKPPKRRWVIVVTSSALASVLVIGGLVAVGTPKFGASRARAQTRACFANQKTLAGAVEMYGLDTGSVVTDLGAVAGDLVNGGYLHSLPEDPGAGEGSFTNYSLSSGGPPCAVHGETPDPHCTTCGESGGLTVRCSVHGTILDPR